MSTGKKTTEEVDKDAKAGEETKEKEVTNAEIEEQLKVANEATAAAEAATLVAEAATKKAEGELKKLKTAKNKEATKDYGKSGKYMSVKLSIYHPYQNIRFDPEVPTNCKLDSWLDSQLKVGIVVKC